MVLLRARRAEGLNVVLPEVVNRSGDGLAETLVHAADQFGQRRARWLSEPSDYVPEALARPLAPLHRSNADFSREIVVETMYACIGRHAQERDSRGRR